MTEQMTNAALRREIAEALGWRRDLREEPIIKYGQYDHSIEGYQTLTIWIAPGGTEHQVSPLYSELLPFPDWPGDLGAALALCLEIGQQHSYDVLISHVGDPLEYMASFKPGTHLCTGFHTTPALALSYLAHAALKAQAVPHG